MARRQTSHKRRYRGGHTTTLSVNNPLDMIGHSIAMVQHHALQTLKHTGDIFKHTFNGIMGGVKRVTERKSTHISSGGRTRRRR